MGKEKNNTLVILTMQVFCMLILRIYRNFKGYPHNLDTRMNLSILNEL